MIRELRYGKQCQEDQVSTQKTGRWPVIGGIAAALAASACCVGPLVLVTLGLGGAWIGNLAALEPYRPIFLALAAILLFLAYRKIYRKPAMCDAASLCAKPGAALGNKVLFWIAVALVSFAALFPYLAPIFY